MHEEDTRLTNAWIRKNVSAVLLAAGLSVRMGGGQDKLLLTYKGKTLLAYAIELMDSFNFYEKILVTTSARLEYAVLTSGIIPVINPHPESGMAESLKLGVAAASGRYYLFLTADLPLLDTAELTRLLCAAKENEGKIVYPAIQGKPCGPALFPSRFQAELLRQTGDTGGRAIRAAHQEDCIAIEAGNPNAFFDIDTAEDYSSLLQ